MLKSIILSLTCGLLFGLQISFAQCSDIGSNLVAPYSSNTSDKGVMFDVSATNTVTIFCFDANLADLSVGDYQIYYKTGSYAGSENSSTDWTLVGSSGSILSNGSNTPTVMDIPVNLVIPAGQTYGFYITASDPAQSTGLLTTTNTGYTTISSNIDMSIMGGIGITYPFDIITSDRSFNGTVFYMPGNVLPLEFTDFTATQINQSVLLEWKTESENNSDYFEIERSSNAADWNKLSKITASGESSSSKKYQEIDSEPLEGISYYRLSQYDLDGARTILKSVSLKNQSGIGENEIKIFPNPVTEQTRIFGDKNELESLKILNSIGQDISGNLTINNQDGYTDIYFNDQQKGVFILKSKTNSRILIKN